MDNIAYAREWMSIHLGNLNSLSYRLISSFANVPSIMVPFNQQRYKDIVNCYLRIVVARAVMLCLNMGMFQRDAISQNTGHSKKMEHLAKFLFDPFCIATMNQTMPYTGDQPQTVFLFQFEKKRRAPNFVCSDVPMSAEVSLFC